MQDVSQPTARFFGVMELLGAIGLIVPAATGIAPVLTPIAGTGLAVIVVLAAAMHIRREEPSGAAVTAILFVLAALVALGSIRPLQLVTAPAARYPEQYKTRRRRRSRSPRRPAPGAVSNVLDRLAADGTVVQTNQKPRRFTATHT